ncbi:MAG TPA: glycosyltransferase [Vicinamibacterales bacterium]|nr:glycosyltransferase [Vicinamibacterales bacterium]
MKFAFVTARYGADITTGPDHACRVLAEQVSSRHDVDVLTTCARNPQSWKNEFSEGTDRVRGALVRRFSVSQSRDEQAFSQFSARVLAGPRTRADELEWLRRAGPWSAGLIDFIRRQHKSYDVLVFFSLCSPVTVAAATLAPERTIVFPYLQLQPALRFDVGAEILSAVRGVGLISGTERQLLRSYMRVTPQHDEVVGVGIDPSPEQSYPRHQQDPADVVVDDEATAAGGEDDGPASYLEGRGVPFRRRHRLYGPFALYGGRVEPDNGCEEMLDYFDTYAASDGDTALALMGVKMMQVPEEPYIRLAGVLPERQRMIACEAADVTIAPSADDLVSQPLLESLAVGTPVLASARNSAAVEHCRRANAGLYYSNRGEFVEALRLMMTNSRLRSRLGENGRIYIRQNFRWDAVLGRFDRLVSKARAR